MHQLLNRRRSVIVAALAVALAGLIAALSPNDARASTPTCSGAQLVETIDSLADGGTAGLQYFELKFTNLGGTCELRGYPGVSAVNLDGRQLGRPAIRDGGTEREITLRAATANSAASADEYIGFADTAAINGCDQRLAAGLRIYAPGSTTAKYVPFVVDACSTDASSYMKLEPIS